jgi:hypothetical protein
LKKSAFLQFPTLVSALKELKFEMHLVKDSRASAANIFHISEEKFRF